MNSDVRIVSINGELAPEAEAKISMYNSADTVQNIIFSDDCYLFRRGGQY